MGGYDTGGYASSIGGWELEGKVGGNGKDDDLVEKRGSRGGGE